jgi:ribosomal protein L34
MKIISGSLQQVTETFLHAGYLSASSGVFGPSGLTGSIADLSDVLVAGAVVFGFLVVLVAATGAVVVARRERRGRRRLWIAVLASLVTLTFMLGAVVTSFFFVLGSAPRDAALH